MYIVKYGNDYLHDPRTDDYMLFDISLECSENAFGFCDFTIQPNHPMYGKLKERDSKNPVEVYDDDVLLFAGYIYELGKEFYLDGHVKCKDELSYLDETIIRPYSSAVRGFGKLAPCTKSAYFEWLIQQHNAQVDSSKQFEIGINEGDRLGNDSDLYEKNDSYPTTWAELSEKLLTEYGGYIRVRHENGLRYIDLLSEWTSENTQILDFGVNLTDYTQTDDSSSVVTYVVPLGARMSETYYSYANGYFQTTDKKVDTNKEYYTKYQDGGYSKCHNLTKFEPGVKYYEYYEGYDESNNLLTIDSFPDGSISDDIEKQGDYIFSRSAVDKYGFIGGTFEDNKTLYVEDLVVQGVLYLKELISPKRTIEIKAVDMHLVNSEIKPIRVGEYVRVRSIPHDVDSYLLCTSIDLNLNNPENSLYTLGTTFDTLTGEQNKRIKMLNDQVNKQYDATTKLTDEMKQAAKSASEIAEEAKRAASDAATDASDAKSEASDAKSEAVEAKDAVSKSIIASTEEFAVSYSPDTAPTSNWTTEVPSYSSDMYIWRRVINTYGDGRTEIGNPVCVTGNGEDGVSVESWDRFYKLQESSLEKPSAPTTIEPSDWSNVEPTYTEGSATTLYTVDRTIFSDSTYSYSNVSKSTSYEAAKAAYNKAVDAKNEADKAAKVATNYIDFVNGIGLIVGDMTTGTLGKNTLIDANGMAVRSGSTELARFGKDKAFIGLYDPNDFSEGKTVSMNFFQNKNNASDALSGIDTTKRQVAALYHASAIGKYMVSNTKIHSNGEVSVLGNGGSGLSAGLSYLGKYDVESGNYPSEEACPTAHASYVDLSIRDIRDTNEVFTPISIRTEYAVNSMGKEHLIKPYINMRGETVIIETQQFRNAKIDYVLDNYEIPYKGTYTFYPVPGVTYLILAKERKNSDNRLLGQYISSCICDELGYLNNLKLASGGGGITVTAKSDTTNKKPYITFKGGSTTTNSDGTKSTIAAYVYLTIKKIDSRPTADAYGYNTYYNNYVISGTESEIMDAYGNRNDNT